HVTDDPLRRYRRGAGRPITGCDGRALSRARRRDQAARRPECLESHPDGPGPHRWRGPRPDRLAARLRPPARRPRNLRPPPETPTPVRRRILWTRKAGVPEGMFKLHAEFVCSVDQAQPTAPMNRLGQTLYAAPPRGAYLDVLSKNGTDNDRLAALARQVTNGKERHSEQTHALFQYVDGR